MTNLIFDYDGTLNNCLKTYRPAFKKAYAWLVENGYAKPHDYSDSEISYWLGFNGNDMWAAFQPDLPIDIRNYCRNIISMETDSQIRSGNAELYNGANEVLDTLKQKGFRLIFLSNCRKSYLKAHNDSFHLDKWFDYMYCAEEFGFIPKHKIFGCIKPKHDGNFIVIGDRFHDMQLADKNNLLSIGCAYGYGSPEELKSADIIINSVKELPDAVYKLSENKS